ncbi:metal ABC transporter substrate-binding protein [Chloroflexi bacterium TSY]|nr:metal ABC transporter substrate-binding protein [Chloroflexi bacterium TSY]
MALTQLFPLGADAHSYKITPQDMATLSNAHVIFINGLGLEEALTTNLTNIGGVSVIAVNAGVKMLVHADKHSDDEQGDDEHAHEAGDPHTWFSIHAVKVWVENIASVLSDLDPANAEVYAMNAAAYRAELETLATELDDLVATLPVNQRKLVTDHEAVSYLAAAYDFTIIGAVIPSFSTMAAPSAQELAQLQKQIETEGVSAIFVSVSANADLSTQIAQDLGIQVVPIYVESLSAADGPAADYIAFMRHTLTTIVEALAP